MWQQVLWQQAPKSTKPTASVFEDLISQWKSDHYKAERSVGGGGECRVLKDHPAQGSGAEQTQFGNCQKNANKIVS